MPEFICHLIPYFVCVIKESVQGLASAVVAAIIVSINLAAKAYFFTVKSKVV